LKTIASSEWKDSSEGFSIINYQLSIINQQSTMRTVREGGSYVSGMYGQRSGDGG